MDKTDLTTRETILSELVPFDKWLKSIGKGRVTGWKWRKSGAVKAINIFGRVYITRTEIARFEARAADGEFVSHIQPRVAPFARSHNRKSVGFIDRLIGRRNRLK
jgi:hypothetical protein